MRLKDAFGEPQDPVLRDVRHDTSQKVVPSGMLVVLQFEFLCESNQLFQRLAPQIPDFHLHPYHLKALFLC